MDIKDSNADLSEIASQIVAEILQIPRSLFCPFCADEYMFEFTLKDHLIRKHGNDIKMRNEFAMNLVDNREQHLCPYCRAVFYLIGLLVKHIVNSHGKDAWHQWQQKANNVELLNDKKENEPSILYAACSPGLSDIFMNLDSNCTFTEGKSPSAPRSILKKTPVKPNIIVSSPSGITIRRNKSEVVKGTLSVRRELRFDLPPLENSPISTESNDANKQFNCFNLKTIFFKKQKNSPKKNKIISRRKNMLVSKNMVTSTPINFLDDAPLSPYLKMTKKEKRNLKKSLLEIRPLLFASERFQCAYCKQRYSSNSDLLSHLKDHNGVQYALRRRYQCGQCQILFYRNSYLVKHCQFQHTPKRRDYHKCN